MSSLFAYLCIKFFETFQYLGQDLFNIKSSGHFPSCPVLTHQEHVTHLVTPSLLELFPPLNSRTTALSRRPVPRQLLVSTYLQPAWSHPGHWLRNCLHIYLPGSDLSLTGTYKCLIGISSCYCYGNGTFFLICKQLLQFFFFFGCPMAYGVPRPGINLSRSCNLHHSCGNAGSFNPLSPAGDRTCILALQRCCWSHCVTTGTPPKSF